jgi:hypothetical protein
MTPKKKTKGLELLPNVVQAALGTQTLTQACRPISEAEKQSLSRAIKMDVDEWRMHFGAQLREAGDEALTQLRAKMGEIKPESLAYTLAVLVDKASAMEGRNQLQNATVNVQVNNYGTAGPTKADILSGLSSIAPSNESRPEALEMAAMGHEGIASSATR